MKYLFSDLREGRLSSSADDAQRKREDKLGVLFLYYLTNYVLFAVLIKKVSIK